VTLAPNAALAARGTNAFELVVGGETVAHAGASALTVRRRVGRLSRGEAVPAFDAAGSPDPALQAQWLGVLDVLAAHNGILYLLHRGERPLCALSGRVPPASDRHERAIPAGRWTLSRFAFLRRGEAGLVLESPLATCRLDISSDEVATWLARLASARRAPPRGVPRAFLSMLHAAGFLTQADRVGAGDDRPALQGWSFADAIMHSRSRAGRHLSPFGATFPLRGTTAPAPPVKPAMSRRAIVLHRPGRVGRGGHLASFTRVLESRRSLRDFAARPLTPRELGEFLYRVAHIQSETRPPGDDRPDTVTFRPTPSGGACHSLEIYVAAANCQGLKPGLYHHDPRHHRLEPVPRSAGAARALVDAARAVVPGAGQPHTMIIVASRFARVSWKYESMAYATILKDAGALLQTMYLVATAMGLAPCAVGGGDAQFFADAIGTSVFEETSVAEFLLGVPRRGRGARGTDP
jgi:SagB-type dehydrogenase family enzyme